MAVPGETSDAGEPATDARPGAPERGGALPGDPLGNPPGNRANPPATAGIRLHCAAPTGIRHVGVVFIHGIGSQVAGETLLDWGGAVVRALQDARVRRGAPADPVLQVQLDPASSESRFVEVQLPTAQVDGTAVAEQHWVLTEAWWAQRVRPPSFGQMAEWLGPRGAIRRILTALLPRREGIHDPRLRGSAEVHGLRRRADGRVEEDADPGVPDGMNRPPGSPVGRAAAAFSAGIALQAVSALLLVVYGALRLVEKLVPIGPLRDGALTRPLDRFVLEWFGDVYVLLSDPAQAASIRGRLIDSIGDLRAAGCDEVVVVAHSGGAIVTFMTLADRSPDELRVDRLITLGEGLNLAWRLAGGQGTAGDIDDRPERLYRPVLSARPELRWDDFWASQDPAPVGVLELPAPADDRATDAAQLARVRSHAVWNRLSFSEDHGGYWENDEEFLIPVLRRIAGGPEAATLFGDEALDHERSNRRRRRLSLLGYWRQVTVAAAFAGVVLSFTIGTGSTAAVADAVSEVFASIPGASILIEPLNAIRAAGLESQPVLRFLAETGVWLVAAAIALAASVTLLAPPGRPVPWARGRRARWVGRALRLAPWIAGIPMAIAIILGAARFVGGSTEAALGAVRGIGVAAVAIVVLALGARVMLRDDSPAPTRVRDATETVVMMLAMVLSVLIVFAPALAIAVFPDVGRTVAGTVAIVVAFQLLGAAGSWRWRVWDERERAAARTGGEYRALGRVVVQVVLLGGSLAALLIAVVAGSVAIAAVAVTGVALLVLVGVAVDVLDSARRDPARGAETRRRSGLTARRQPGR